MSDPITHDDKANAEELSGEDVSGTTQTAPAAGSHAEHQHEEQVGDGNESLDIDTGAIFEPHAMTKGDFSAKPILTVDNLRMYFPVKNSGIIRRTVGYVQAVDGISFQVPEGGSLGLVGESGCGKSTTGRLITRLYKPTEGKIDFDGKDIANYSARQLMPLRREIQMIFQDPATSLNPRHTVGTIVGAPLMIHSVVPRNKVMGRVKELLEVVGLNPEHYNRYPHEFSGGQRQRIGIARALTLQPKLLVADEPVSALDVSIQAQVINLLQDLQNEFKISFLFIAHDLAVVRHFCPEVAVMYLGKIVEVADRDTIYLRPHHPYTQALLSAVPDVRQAAVGGRRERIRLQGDVPSPINPPSGCRFHPRCRYMTDICKEVEPPLVDYGRGHLAACHHPLNVDRETLERVRVSKSHTPGSADEGAKPRKPGKERARPIP
jgi:peptide/nickel transport system ATP-binding protein/oligopeptide transport system ATP-binding protein